MVNVEEKIKILSKCQIETVEIVQILVADGYPI